MSFFISKTSDGSILAFRIDEILVAEFTGEDRRGMHSISLIFKNGSTASASISAQDASKLLESLRH